MGGVNTAAGAKLYIGTTATVGSTDTFTEIAEVVNLGEFGRIYNTVKYNPIGSRGTQKFKGSYDDGTLKITLGRNTSDAGQSAIRTALDVDANYNFKIQGNDAVPARTATVTITIAAPGAVSWTAHSLNVNDPVSFTTTGALPTGLTASTTYYVKTVTDANTFTVSATPGGSAITTTGSQSGVHTGSTVPAPSNFIFKAQVMSYTANFGTVDAVVQSTLTIEIQSGTIVETARAPTA